MTDTHTLKQDFWKTLADSPFLFLQLDADPHTAVPMTAQLDENAEGAIWFFTSKDHNLAKGGPATATFIGKGHDMFARIQGRLSEETSKLLLDRHWSPSVEAWFPGGKTDPNLMLLRMDLGRAEIWNSDLGFLDNAKKMLGLDDKDAKKGEHAETIL